MDTKQTQTKSKATKPELTPQQINFSNKNKAQIVIPSPETEASDILSALNLKHPNTVFLIVGSSDNLDDEINAHLIQLFSRGIARAAAEIGAVIIDGGRQTGIMAMMGQGVADREYKSPLIGVAPTEKVTYPDGPVKGDVKDSEPLDHNHSHFVLTDGHEWGDETETMCQLAGKLAQNKPVVTILASGDNLTKKQILYGVRHKWPVIIIKGSGNLANELESLWNKKSSFIPDPDLAEIISDGQLHFFPLKGSINDFERHLKQLSDPNPEKNDTPLELAWHRFAMYDANANRQQVTFSGLQKWILVLGVVGTLLALVQNQLETSGIEQIAEFAEQILYYVILTIPPIVTFLAVVSNRLNAGTKWILSRAGAESLKKEIYRYRARAEIYNDKNTKKISRDIKLIRKIHTISSKLMQTEVNTSAMPNYTGPIPPKYGAAEGDDGLSFLPSNRYLKFRLQEQLAYYRGKTNSLEKQLRRLQILIYLAGLAGTVLAAIGLELWIALTTSLATAFTTHLEYQKVEEKLMRYNQTANDLSNIEGWWVALSAKEQANPANVDKLVGQTETTLHQEHAAWVQDMQDAMADERNEQASEEKEQGVDQKKK